MLRLEHPLPSLTGKEPTSMATRTKKLTAEQIAAANQQIADNNAVLRGELPICRKCGRTVTDENKGSVSRDGKHTCKDCLEPTLVTTVVTVPDEPTAEVNPADVKRQKMLDTLAKARAIR